MKPSTPAKLCGVLSGLLSWWLVGLSAIACEHPATMREATLQDIRAFFEGKNMTVLTFVGYSGAEYEDKAVMLEQARNILDQVDPTKTIVNIGATAEGIGGIYEVAKRKGFLTTGLVSTQAQEHNVAVSPCVDIVFFVRDATWGGFLEGTEQLSPTSTAVVENSDIIVGIGGGEVARDEMVAAKRAGKQVRFIAADMNHQRAQEKARQKGLPVPTDFKGAAAAVF